MYHRTSRRLFIRVMAIPDKGGEWGVWSSQSGRRSHSICFAKLTLKILTLDKTPTSTTRPSNWHGILMPREHIRAVSRAKGIYSIAPRLKLAHGTTLSLSRFTRACSLPQRYNSRIQFCRDPMLSPRNSNYKKATMVHPGKCHVSVGRSFLFSATGQSPGRYFAPATSQPP